MALVDIPYLYYPPLPARCAGSPTNSGKVIDAAGEKQGGTFYATATATIRKVGFPVQLVTSSGDVDVRIETIDATTGLPSGTLVHASADATITISATGWNTADFGDGNGAPVTRGTQYAVVIQDNASSAPNIQIGVSNNDQFSDFPYQLGFVSSWAKVSNVNPIFSLEFADATYMVLPLNNQHVATAATSVFSNASSPDHRGLKFQVPFACRIAGCWTWFDMDGNADIKLYDSDGTTVLETQGVDKDIRRTTAGNIQIVWFDNSEILTIDTFYRIAVAPSTTTSIRYYNVSINSTAIMDSLPGTSNWHSTSKKDAGWTDVTSTRPVIGLIIDQLDNGVSAGGLITHPGMAGGMRG